MPSFIGTHAKPLLHLCFVIGKTKNKIKNKTEMEIMIPLNRYIKECQHCKNLFCAQRTDTKYCSHSCRQLAFLERKAVKQSSGHSSAQQPIVVKRKDGFIKRFLKALW
jgi:hypothetical protein